MRQKSIDVENLHHSAPIPAASRVGPILATSGVGGRDPATGKLCAELEQQFENAGLDVLLDDRDERPGAKFATLDLIGLPWQVVVGPKGLAEGKVEVKQRRGGAREQLSPQDAVSHIVAAVKAARG